MKKKFALLALALSAVAATMTLAPSPSQAVQCWTTCCPNSTFCFTCCLGRPCTDVACPPA